MTLSTPTQLEWSNTRIGFDSSGGGAARSGEKGGLLLGTSTTARYVENGWSFVMLFNSSIVNGNHVSDLATLLNNVPRTRRSLPALCLFPSFDIPSFPP